MNLLVRVLTGTVVAGVTLAVGVVGDQIPAGAPQMVAKELAAQRALGYHPCEPRLGQIPAQEAHADPDFQVYAWAGGTMPGEDCIVEFAADVPADAVDWVAWHEVCHLSTLNDIFADPFRPIIDAAHRHVAFLACIGQGPAETGGYLH